MNHISPYYMRNSCEHGYYTAADVYSYQSRLLLLNIAQGFSHVCQYEFLHCNGRPLKKNFDYVEKVASSFQIKMAKIRYEFSAAAVSEDVHIIHLDVIQQQHDSVNYI